MARINTRRVKAVSSRKRVSNARPAVVLADDATWSRRRAICWLENLRVQIDMARDELFFGYGRRFGAALTEAERKVLAETLEAAQIALGAATPAHDDSFRPRSI